MAQPEPNLVKFYPPLDPSIPPEIAMHIRLQANAANDHDQAITTLKQQLTDAVIAHTAVTNNIVQQIATAPSSSSSSFGSISNQSGSIAYTTQGTDNGALIVISNAAAIAVTLNSIVSTPFATFLTNLGAGTTTLTPSSGTVNGGATFTVPSSYTTLAVFDGVNWWASTLPLVPATIAAVASNWLRSYNAVTGLFTASQPAFADITGQITTAQLPAAGISITIVTAALTTLGSQGSMTFVNGLLTASVAAT